jgi:hypothetical protein
MEPERPQPKPRAKPRRAAKAPLPPNDWKALVMRSRESPSLAPRRKRQEPTERQPGRKAEPPKPA